MLLKLTLTVTALLLTNYFYHLTRNYIAARRLSLPIIICPLTSRTPLWTLIATILPLQRLYALPGLHWLRYSYHGWLLHDTYHSHHYFGRAFIIVSASANELIVNDPRAIAEIFGRYKKWERPREEYGIFSLLGENVDSVSGEEWSRHRRVVNAGFMEESMHFVWLAAEKQVGQWAKEMDVNFKDFSEAMDTLSANVLMSVVFGKDYDFDQNGSSDVVKGQRKSFVGAMQTINSNLSLAWAVKDNRIPAFMQSKKTKTMRDSTSELKVSFKDILQNPGSSFISAMLEVNTEKKPEAGKHRRLTDDELCGNLFILQLAGSDTTGYAISFTMALLSIHPDIQDWIREELVSTTGGYEGVYPKALRCRAAIVETLRLHSPAPSFPRHSLKPEILQIAGEDYIVPPEMMISGNIPSIHNDPWIWGDDAGEWKPQRWIEVVGGSERLQERFEMMAWSAGPRVCPGKKFSLVEVVAVICMILKKYRLEGTPNMQKVLLDFKYSGMPKLKTPESASIKFIELESSPE